MRDPRMSCSVRSMECLDSWNNWLDWSVVYNGIAMSYLFNSNTIKQHEAYHKPINKQFIYCLSPIRCRYYLASCMRVKHQCQATHPGKLYSVSVSIFMLLVKYIPDLVFRNGSFFDAHGGWLYIGVHSGASAISVPYTCTPMDQFNSWGMAIRDEGQIIPHEE